MCVDAGADMTESIEATLPASDMALTASTGDTCTGRGDTDVVVSDGAGPAAVVPGVGARA